MDAHAAASLAYHLAREAAERRMARCAGDERSRTVHLQLAARHKLAAVLLAVHREAPAEQAPARAGAALTLSAAACPESGW